MMLCRSLYDANPINRLVTNPPARSAPVGGISTERIRPVETQNPLAEGFRINDWTVEPEFNRMSGEGVTRRFALKGDGLREIAFPELHVEEAPPAGSEAASFLFLLTSQPVEIRRVGDTLASAGKPRLGALLSS